METQTQQQMQSQKRSAQELRETRNKLICEGAEKGVSIKSLAYMFSLSEQMIRKVTQGVTFGKVQQASIEQLEAVREVIKKNLTQQNYTSGEIEFIVGKGSLAQAETIRNLQEQIKYYKGLEMQHHIDVERLRQEKAKVNADWQKKYDEQTIIARTLLARSPDLESKISGLEKEKEDLTGKIKGLEQKLKDEMEISLSLGDKLLKAEEDNVFLKEGQSRLDGEIKYLTADVQNLEQEKQALSEKVADLTETKGSLEQDNQTLSLEIAKLNKIVGDLTAEIQGLKQEKAKLNADWTERYNDKLKELKPAYEKMNETNKGLLSKLLELEQEKGSLLAQVKGLEQQLLEAEQKVTGIETEKEELTAEIEGLRQQKANKTNTSERIIYTEKQRKRMKRVFRDCNYNRAEALKVLHAEGIMVSYRHLGTIVEGIKPKKQKK